MTAIRQEVVGLKELQLALREIDSTLPRRMRLANNVVAERVATAATDAAERLGSVAAHVAGTIRAASEQTAAAVKLGNAKHPEALGAEFGSIHYHQFKAWTGNEWTDPESLSIGYFLHPTIRAEVSSGRVRDDYDKAIEELTKIAFPN